MRTQMQRCQDDLRLARLLKDQRNPLSVRADDDLEYAASAFRSMLEAQGRSDTSGRDVIRSETSSPTADPDAQLGRRQLTPEAYQKILERNGDVRALDRLTLTPHGAFLGKTIRGGQEPYLPPRFEERSGFELGESFPPSLRKIGPTREPTKDLLSLIPAESLHDSWLKALLQMGTHDIDRLSSRRDEGRIYPTPGLNMGSEPQAVWALSQNGGKLLVLNPAQVFQIHIECSQRNYPTRTDQIIVLGIRSKVFPTPSENWTDIPSTPDRLPYIIHLETNRSNNCHTLRFGPCSSNLLKQINTDTGNLNLVPNLVRGRNSFTKNAKSIEFSDFPRSDLYVVKETPEPGKDTRDS